MSEEAVNTIFVVDDVKVIANTLAAILNHSGFQATAFVNPLEALQAAEKNCPNYLITDVVMPELNGIELTALFKAIHPECKVLLFSGMASTADLLARAREQGLDFQVLAKPVHPKELLAALKAL
jgi:CheY-like chemotaxis protein